MEDRTWRTRAKLSIGLEAKSEVELLSSNYGSYSLAVESRRKVISVIHIPVSDDDRARYLLT